MILWRKFFVAALVSGLSLGAGLGFSKVWRGPVKFDGGFVVLDKSGNVRASLFADDEGVTKFWINGHDGRPRISMFSCLNGLSGVAIGDQSGIQRVALGVNKNSISDIEVFDSSGYKRFSLKSGPDGNAEFSMLAPGNKDCVLIKGFSDGSGDIRIVDNNRLLFKAPNP